MSKTQLMRLVGVGLLATMAVASGAQAATQQAAATVSATVPSRSDVALARDASSVTRGSPSQLVFDRYDDQDGQSDGNPGFMYAPYRSETSKNWHIARIAANGSSLTLTVTTTGTIGSSPIADRLKIFCGGFFAAGATDPIAGTKTPENTWDSLAGSGFSRSLSQSFNGTVPFSYQLNVSGISSGTYAGTVTFTLTSN